MNLQTIIDTAIAPALAIFPEKLNMDTPAARVLLLAIGCQETDFATRRQAGGASGRSYWQFERNGVVGAVRSFGGRHWYV